MLLDEGYYDPSLRQLSSALVGILLLGTPHPRFDRIAHDQAQLEALLCSIQSLSKSRLEKIRGEVAALCALSTRFEAVPSERPVWSVYEQRPTKYPTTAMLRWRTEIVWNSAPNHIFGNILTTDTDRRCSACYHKTRVRGDLWCQWQPHLHLQTTNHLSDIDQDQDRH